MVKNRIEIIINLSLFGISFSLKPLVVGGLRSEPEVRKRVDDFGLALGYYYDKYLNHEYVENTKLHVVSYANVIDGTIFGDRY